MNNLKKILGIFGITTIIFAGFNFANATTGVVNTPAVRVRESASTDAKVLTKAYEDEEIEILSEEGDWYKVKVNGKTGYASKSLIDVKDKTESPAPSNTNTITENTTTENTTAEKENASEPSNYETETSTDVTTSNVSEKKVLKEDVYLKLLPNFASSNLKLASKNLEITILDEFNNWIQISVENTTGWILKNKIIAQEVENVTEEPSTETPIEETKKEEEKTPETEIKNLKGKIKVETANVREKADKTSNIVEHLDEGDEVIITEEIGEWYKITSTKISSGYVSKSLVIVTSEVSSRNSDAREEEVIATVNSALENDGKGIDVVSFAKQFLGKPYVLGGKTPETGFDCSGFTRYVFLNFGFSLGTVAADQTSLGKEISKDELKEGDLILFYNEAKTKIGHTGIYIGENEFIHAANPERGVVIDNLKTNSYYVERFVTARRIVE